MSADIIKMNAKKAVIETGIDLTQDGLALGIGSLWRDDARFVAAWKRWLFYRAGIWHRDERLEHMTRAREYLRSLAEELPAEYEAKRKDLRKADTVAKVVGLACSNPAQAASVEQWDADPYQFGHPDPEEEA